MSTIQKIREHFLKGGKISACEAARRFLTPDLRKYVSDLRNAKEPKDRMEIRDEWRKSKDGKRYKVYFL